MVLVFILCMCFMQLLFYVCVSCSCFVDGIVLKPTYSFTIYNYNKVCVDYNIVMRISCNYYAFFWRLRLRLWTALGLVFVAETVNSIGSCLYYWKPFFCLGYYCRENSCILIVFYNVITFHFWAVNILAWVWFWLCRQWTC